ncbi:MAG TPA: HIT domain-containing protein [Candidatus Babeliales bacterium]|nr:HIT domain-containing protein [Candidatus Babeliales bacterium]
MALGSCIFCKIISKEIPSSFIAETEDLVVLKDLYPKAPTHYLIIPKKHIPNVLSLNDKDLAGKMFDMVRTLSEKIGNSSFKLAINSGKFQHVPHLHMHFLAGDSIELV